MENDHGTGNQPEAVVDRSRGIFNWRFAAVLTDENAVRRQFYSFVFLNRSFQGIGNQLSSLPVEDLKDLAQRFANCLRARPTRHPFRYNVKVADTSQDVGAEYSIPNGVESY